MNGIKKLTALILVVLLLASVTTPALAATDGSSEELDSRLAAVTLLVKEQLGITDEYASFYGYLTQDNENPLWSLNWSSDAVSLNVSAGEDGTVYYMYYSDDKENYIYDPYFDPIFPSATRAEAKDAAEAFLASVLRTNETVVFEDDTMQSLRDTDNYYYGALYVNGLETPQSVNMRVRSSDLRIMMFSRSDNYGIKGGYPSPDTTVTAEKAAATIAGKYDFEPCYIVVGDDNVAKVVYMPITDGNWVVDAKTGEPFDLNSAYSDPGKGDYSATPEATTADEAGDYSLTPAELEGISKLEGALTSDELDAIVRAKTVFGVDDAFELSYVSYYLDNATGDISAYVRFTETVADPSKYGVDQAEWDEIVKEGNVPMVYKYFSMDGKTGDIDYISTSYSGFGWEVTEREAGAVPAAVTDYLTSIYSAEYAACELSSASGYSYGVDTDSFTYTQKVNGYFFYNNQISVTVCAATGCIDSLWISWDYTVTFAPANVTVTPEQAAAVYASALKTELCYKVSNYIYDEYWNTECEMMLAWAPGYDGYITGIDAEAGELIADTYEQQTMSISYTDIGGSFAKSQIETLAQYGVGFYSDTFKPTATLTQKDMILLLLSADGYQIDYDSITDTDLDWIYSSAESLGIVKSGDREPERAITRAELCRVLISMSGYGKAAKLPGIYVCGFSDDTSIAASDYGYVAIAKGLGIIKGNPSGAFKPNNAVTRQEAAVMFFRFMDRPHDSSTGAYDPPRPMPVDIVAE